MIYQKRLNQRREGGSGRGMCRGRPCTTAAALVLKTRSAVLIPAQRATARYASAMRGRRRRGECPSEPRRWTTPRRNQLFRVLPSWSVEGLGDTSGGNLDQAAGFDQPFNSARIVEKFRGALGVGQDETDTGPLQPRGDLAQIDEEVVRHLDQEIPSAVGDAQQFSPLPGGFEVRPGHDLGTGEDGESEVLLAQSLRELADAVPNELRRDGTPMVVLMGQGGG